MKTLTIRDVEQDKVNLGTYTLKGWVRTHRSSKNVAFIELNDGTAVKGLQVVIEPDMAGYVKHKPQITTGASVIIEGDLIESPAKGQKYEFQAKSLELVGESDPESYPLQKKGHSYEFLREIAHLRPRSNSLGAVFRVRSVAAGAVHSFFQEQGFYYLTSPIITTSDCEGAGELFQVTNLDLENVPKADGKVDYSQDFFKEKAGLTVSGQLEAEVFATALSKVYTFGPTFRAENSNTSRHLSEFWMIEPEAAFYELSDNMDLAERFLKHLIKTVLEKCPAEMSFFNQWIEKGVLEAVEKVEKASFAHMTYTEAIDVLEKADHTFEYPVSWGIDMQSEHERYLSEHHVGGPLFVTDYPKEIKPFYMRHNEDGKTVRAMDMLVPRIGELIGGSQREERYDLLEQRIKEQGIPVDEMQWYLDLRKFGTVPHSGFGLGFERFMMYITGMKNIRDVIPFPRHPGYAKI